MKKWGAGLVLIAIVGLLSFFFLRRHTALAPKSLPANATEYSARAKNPGSQFVSDPAMAQTNRTPARSPTLSAVDAQKAFMRSKILSTPAPTMPELTNIRAQAVLENMRGAFRQYTERFGGNPVGTNPEITAALNGGNPKQVQFLNAEDGLRINENGELVDSWGTPFFFHQLSAQVMEIHSAGPDRVMWTGDDLVVK